MDSAFKGKTVTVYDIAHEALDGCRAAHLEYATIYASEVGASDADIAVTMQRLTYTTDLAAAVAQADLVIEAVPELPDVKTTAYKEMAELLPAHTLVATNTSTFLPSDFASATGDPTNSALSFRQHDLGDELRRNHGSPRNFPRDAHRG